VQRNIALILSAIDDRITLLRETNETLEAIAQTLFKSWFIDFSPVRAKLRGEIPDGIDEATAKLFPDSFEESELGMIPKEWTIKKLSDLDLEIESGKRPKGEINKNLVNGVPSVGAESIAAIGEFDFSKVKFVSEDFATTSKKGWVKNYDVALYKDGAYVSKVTMYGEGFPFDRFMVNEHVFLLRSKQIGPFFLFWLLSSDVVKNKLIALGTSKAAQPGLNQEEVLSCNFVFPPQELIDSFNKIIFPLAQRQFNLGRQIYALSRIRDSLLPKLILGEINPSELGQL
jgi:type I restriction enzyme S subunit